MKPVSPKKDDQSALTGRTMAQIAADKQAIWHSNRTAIPGLDLAALPRAEMKFVPPMLAKPASVLPDGSDWRYEIKLDGYRGLAVKNAGTVQLFSRRQNTLNDRFPGVVDGLNALEDGLIVDGEIVALDAEGRPSFNLLQHSNRSSPTIVFYIFDVLAYRERDVRSLPLRQRRDLLNEISTTLHEPIRISPVLDAAPADLIPAIKAQGLEGVIAKQFESRYESGDRSGLWLKVRVNKGQELVVGGYRPGKNYFDNLAVGYYDDAKRLIFIAKIKNGFTPELKKEVFDRFRCLETEICPFDNLPEPKTARRGEALTAEAMKNYRWLKPELVAQVEFTDWTAADHLRHSRFAGLRDDKDARDVQKES